MPRLVTLTTYPNEPAALIAQAILRGGGIDSIVSQEAAGSIYPGLQFLGGARLQVAEDDVEAATELLRDAEEAED